MSITRDGGEITFNCDTCPEYVETGEEDFGDAFALAKGGGWRARKEGSEWVHDCPSCAEDRKNKK